MIKEFPWSDRTISAPNLGENSLSVIEGSFSSDWKFWRSKEFLKREGYERWDFSLQFLEA